MQTRLQLLHSWTTQLQQLLPTVRVTRVRVLALFSLALCWTESTALIRLAANLPLPATDLSTDRRLRRWLANPRVIVPTLWTPLLRALLARCQSQELTLVFDPTNQTDRATVAVLGLVVHRRVLPLAWRVLPGNAPWPLRMEDVLLQLCQQVAAVLPGDCRVTLVADRGIPAVALFDCCHACGWHAVVRLSADARQGALVRLADGRTCPVWELVSGPGGRWQGTVTIFRSAGWRTLELTIRWPPGYEEPWLLLSDRPAGQARVIEYRRRTRIEATFQDCKRRGWNLEASKLEDLARLDRLVLAVVLALWWLSLLGLQVIRRGLRRRYDRADRRDLSVVRLGRRWLAEAHSHLAAPPLPFRHSTTDWSCRWTF